ncbi:M23 family metallopeptidase [Scrofimicrobium sp. R131]|uniref:M23 family metallopeptidase n=1 Tax=Scrofimicrobium appendicitidis TaxID=3079930 RepID=A0AAU7VAN9_9ACTO
MTASEQPQCPLPSRRQVHAPAHRPARPSRKPQVMLGVVALTVPLVGFASAAQKDPGTEKVLGNFGGHEDWGNAESISDELLAVPAAASRAKVRTPIEVCVAADQSADGARQVLQRSNTIWPLQEGSFTVASEFSWRVSPISGELLQHEGVDLAAASDTPIYAAMDGIVTEVGYNDRSGNYIELTHETDDGIYHTYYMHQWAENILVTEGQAVTAGEQIGGVGSTGWSTGPHLHFEVRTAADEPVDPVEWLAAHDAVYLGEACQ